MLIKESSHIIEENINSETPKQLHIKFIKHPLEQNARIEINFM